MGTPDSFDQRMRDAAALLRRAEQPIRLLRSIAWSGEVRERFLAAGGKELPVVSYSGFDASPTRAMLADARRLLGGSSPPSPIEHWLRRTADSLELSAEMLCTLGTPAFFRHARSLYGIPSEPVLDGESAPLDCAEELESVLADMAPQHLGAPPAACHLASELVARIRETIDTQLPGATIDIEIVDQLSANVVAGPRRIRVRRSACFSDHDLHQLVEHEVLVHVATALNGREQTDLPILGASHAGTTRTQEGLAVFAEVITGAMDVDRLQRLADRVLAIQRAIDGADFIDNYQFFLERGITAEQAFENTRRVYRGGVLTGGAPFPKDTVYLDGLLRVHNFMRASVRADRLDCFRLLFCGKLDLEDLPGLCEAAARGLCRPPRYLPRWASDLRQLVAHLAYSSFLDQVKLGPIRQHYDALLADAMTSSSDSG